MFCTKCGTEIGDGMSFCTKCGNKVSLNGFKEERAGAEQSDQTSNGKHTNKKAIVISAIILVTAALVAGVIVVFAIKNKQAAKDEYMAFIESESFQSVPESVEHEESTENIDDREEIETEENAKEAVKPETVGEESSTETESTVTGVSETDKAKEITESASETEREPAKISAALPDGVWLTDCNWPKTEYSEGAARDVSFSDNTMTIYASFYQYNHVDWTIAASYPAESRTFYLAPGFTVFGRSTDSDDVFYYTVHDCEHVINTHNGLCLAFTIENGEIKEIEFIS